MASDATIPTGTSLDLDGIIKHHDGPKLGGNVFSRLTFWPATRVVRVGAKRAVQKKDLWTLDITNTAEYLWKQFSPHWREEKRSEKPSLLSALWRTFKWILLQSVFLQTLSSMLLFVQPILIPYLIEYLSDLTQPVWLGYFYAVIIIVSSSLSSVCQYHAYLRAWTLGLNVRSTLTVLIYRKVLKLAPGKGRNSGDIINLISTDAQQILDTIDMFVSGLVSPFVIAGAIALMWIRIGAYSLICLGVLLLSLPVDTFVGAKVGSAKATAQQSTDNRVKLIREMISSIRIVKSYAWENPFRERLISARKREVKNILFSHKLLVALWSVTLSVAPVGIVITFLVFGAFSTLDVTRVWTAMTLFNILRQPLMFLPITITSAIEDKVAVDRIQAFTMRPELPTKSKTDNGSKKRGVMVEAKDCDLAWDSTPILRNITFKVKRGQLFMVIGRVGAGKSTLMQAVMGEVPVLKGLAKVNGTVAYVPQEAWILNGKLRDNILFGKPYHKELYERVIQASALSMDLTIMPAGDLTEIGDRGVNLSGGQKQRALYSDRDVYLLDDPLSALDSAVGEHVFQHAIYGFLRERGKTIILVTNHLQYLPYADYILMLDQGQIAEHGTFDDLKNNGKQFAALMAEFGAVDKKEQPEKSADKQTKPQKSDNANNIERLETQGKEVDEKLGKLIEDEERERGQVNFNVYWYYFKGGGILLFFFVVFVDIVCHGCNVVSMLWLSIWSSDADYQLYSKETCTLSFIPLAFHIKLICLSPDMWIYAIFGFGEPLALFLFMWIYAYFQARTSLTIHTKLLDSVIRATTGFFDATPFGRLMSRFSKDMSIIDIVIPLLFIQYIDMLITLLSVFVFVIASSWYLVFPVLIVLLGYFGLTTYYRKTAIEIQRLESLSRAPVFSHLSETIDGAVSIRAYDMTKAFKVANMNKIDANTVDFYSLRYANLWFGIRLDWLGTFLMTALFFVMVILRNYSTINVAIASVPMSNAVTLTFLFAGISMSLSEMETRMNSVERVKQYNHVPQENPDIKQHPPKDWPQHGQIKLKNLTVSYNGRDIVLDNITATIKAREKIGIVGRTGAGKSTLMASLFRLVEPTSGKIIIDKVNTGDIGLHDLRSKLSIIPQTPTMFIGTVRYNLDPFDEHTDAELWRSLEMVNLKEFVQNNGGLDYVVEENGQNFSVGQRQMLSMARALVRNSSILLLDEATASLDSESDALIQKMVRKYFADKTVITIAHRLHTVMDSDRIMVLDKGRLVEFDTPRNLLERKGLFASMVDATGPKVSKHLRDIAYGRATVTDSVPKTRKKNKDAR